MVANAESPNDHDRPRAMTFEKVRSLTRSAVIWLERFACLLAVVGANYLIASSYRPRDVAMTCRCLLSGPLSGWLVAAELHEYPGALQTLVPLTAGCVVPLVFHVRRKSRIALVAAAAFWVFSGLTFCIGIWL